MKLRNYVTFFVGLAALLINAGCARYSAQSLNRATNSSQKIQAHALSFTYHVFDKADCKKYLDRNVLAKGYQPVSITVYNNTPHYINISKSSFSLPFVPSTEVAHKVHTSTLARAAIYGTLGIFLWPFLIPAIVDGVGSSQANHKLDEDFVRKEFCDQTISPYDTATGLIFVPTKHFNHNFSLTAFDVETRSQLVLSTLEPYTSKV